MTTKELEIVFRKEMDKHEVKMKAGSKKKEEKDKVNIETNEAIEKMPGDYARKCEWSQTLCEETDRDLRDTGLWIDNKINNLKDFLVKNEEMRKSKEKGSIKKMLKLKLEIEILTDKE